MLVDVLISIGWSIATIVAIVAIARWAAHDAEIESRKRLAPFTGTAGRHKGALPSQPQYRERRQG